MGDMSRWRRMAALVPALLGLAACAQAIDTAKAPAPTPESGLQRGVRELLANHAAGRHGSVQGIGVITGALAVFLENEEVNLIPHSPELGAVLGKIHGRWVEGRRQPLAMQELQRALVALALQREVVKRLGGESLILIAKANQKGQFRFEQVPEGRWFLVAGLNSEVSALLWAVPVEVIAGSVSETSLADQNILLESRIEKAEAAPAR